MENDKEYGTPGNGHGGDRPGLSPKPPEDAAEGGGSLLSLNHSLLLFLF